MAAETTMYRPENVGDWGVPQASAGGSYGTDTLALADGVKLFFRYWRAPDAQAPALIVLHGLGAHTGWFIDMGNALNARGLTVYMDDHRGFGRSGGARGHVRDATMYLRDSAAFLNEVEQRQPGAPLFVLGHSMGGIFATYVARADAAGGQNRLRGLILVNPWIQDVVKVPATRVIPGIVAGMLGSAKPFPLEPDTTLMTSQPEATQLLNADTYWVRNQSKAFLYQISRLRLALPKRARQVRLPALVIQTEGDRTLSQAATRRFYERLASADKTYVTYPDFGHDFEFEPHRAVLDDGLADWIMRHRA
jgi:alpha-beta hydrolase superfamily lysophospholipase